MEKNEKKNEKKKKKKKRIKKKKSVIKFCIFRFICSFV